MKKEEILDVIVGSVTLIYIFLSAIFKFTLFLFAFISFFFIYIGYPRYISKLVKCPKCGSKLILNWEKYFYRKFLCCESCGECFNPPLGRSSPFFLTISLSWIISTVITGYMVRELNNSIIVFFFCIIIDTI